ncbi:hypothetical protein GCM10007854_08300 [Algimonas porphyrae]|uniref:ABC transmembrane type-1 domain-containing protein n=2 Tax=Algimonas porphyrae TaxID=1128113 RepID=A0ABQ5UX39_9PROT|nr:hypothetical protein GCM10007854_08300 [Algimonas porphyrae]
MTLLQRSGAGNLDRLLADRSLSRIKTLRTFAVVNQEQASAAFRITVVANVTIPVVIITVLNLIFPGSPADMFRSLFALNEGGTVFVWLLVVAYLSLLAGGLGFGIANLSNARDIRHLIDLHAAERGIFFGLEDEDALQSG